MTTINLTTPLDQSIISSLSTDQTSLVRERLVLEDFFDYLNNALIDEGAVAGNAVRNAIMGDPSDIAQILGIRGSSEILRLRNIPVLTRALDAQISANGDLQALYAALSPQLNDPTRVNDLNQVLATLQNGEGLDPSQQQMLGRLSMTHRTILRERLILEDFFGYLNNSLIGDAAIANSAVRNALLGDPSEIARLLGITNRAQIQSLRNLPTLRRFIDYKIRRASVAQTAFNALDERLSIHENNIDLRATLCALGANGDQSYCPAVSSLGSQTLEQGREANFSITGRNLPRNARVRFLISAPATATDSSTTIYLIGTDRYVEDTSITVTNVTGEGNSLAMHLAVAEAAQLDTQRVVLVESGDYELYRAYLPAGPTVVAATEEAVVSTTLLTPNVTGVSINAVNRAPAGQPAEATPMTITVENIPEVFDLANIRVEFYLNGELDPNIVVVEDSLQRSGNDFQVQIRVPAVAELGARTVRVTLVDGDNETHGELANAFNVLEGNGERVEGEDSPAWASAGDFWTENAGNVYLRSNSGFTTFSFEGLTPRDEIVPSLQHLPDTAEAFHLSFAMGSESEPATLFGSNAALFYRDGWPDVFSLMYWTQADYSYYYHSGENQDTMSGRVQLGLLPRFNLGDQHRGILDFGIGYEYQEFDYFDTLNFRFFDGPRHTLSAQLGGGYQNDLLFFRMAFMYRLTSATQEIPGLPSFNGTTNMWGGRLDLDLNFSRSNSRAPDLEIFFETLGGEAELPVYRNSELTGARIDMRQIYRAGITLDWHANSYRPYVTGSFSYETTGDEEPTMGIVTRAGLYVGPERGGHFSRPYHLGAEFNWMQNQSVYYGGRQIYGGLFIETPYLLYRRLGVGNLQEPNGNSYTDFRMEVGIDLLQIIGLARDRAARRSH